MTEDAFSLLGSSKCKDVDGILMEVGMVTIMELKISSFYSF